jgi:hypothetical protein
MSRIYDGSIISVQGMNFKITLEHDDCCGPPWEECDGHGPVSGTERRHKAAGEMILCEDRGCKRFYDFQAAVQQAKREGWNTAPYVWRTKGEQAHHAALADFEYLRRWCNGDWEYVILGVHLLDDDDEDMGESEYLGGVEYDPCDTSYVAQMAEELAEQIINRIERPFTGPNGTDWIEPHEEIDGQEHALPVTYVSI